MKISLLQLIENSRQASDQQQQDVFRRCQPSAPVVEPVVVDGERELDAFAVSQSRQVDMPQSDYYDYGVTAHSDYQILSMEEVGHVLGSAASELTEDAQRQQMPLSTVQRSGATLLASYIRNAGDETQIYSLAVGQAGRIVCAQQSADGVLQLSRLTAVSAGSSMQPMVSVFSTDQPALILQASTGIFGSATCHEHDLLPFLDSSDLEKTSRAIHQYAAGYQSDSRTLYLIKADAQASLNHGTVSVIAQATGASPAVAEQFITEFQHYYLRREFIVAALLNPVYLKLVEQRDCGELQAAESVEQLYDGYAIKLRELFAKSASESVETWENNTAAIIDELLLCLREDIANCSDIQAIPSVLATAYREIRCYFLIKKQLRPLEIWLAEAIRDYADDSVECSEAHRIYDAYYEQVQAIFAQSASESLAEWERRTQALDDVLVDNALIDEFRFLEILNGEALLNFADGKRELEKRLSLFAVITHPWLSTAEVSQPEFSLVTSLIEGLPSLPYQYVMDLGQWLDGLVAYSNQPDERASALAHCVGLLEYVQGDEYQQGFSEFKWLQRTISLHATKVTLTAMVCVDPALQPALPINAHYFNRYLSAIEQAMLAARTDNTNLIALLTELRRKTLQEQLLAPLDLLMTFNRIPGEVGRFSSSLTVKIQSCQSAVDLAELQSLVLQAPYGQQVYSEAEVPRPLAQLQCCLFLLMQCYPGLRPFAPAAEGLPKLDAQKTLIDLLGVVINHPGDQECLQKRLLKIKESVSSILSNQQRQSQASSDQFKLFNYRQYLREKQQKAKRNSRTEATVPTSSPLTQCIRRR